MTVFLSQAQQDELIHFIHRLGNEAGAIARSYFQQTLEIEIKADTSPVTRADQEIEERIIELIRTHYPGHGIYGEESGLRETDADWIWVIDPIDGTKAFIAGKSTFVTLIALCQRTIPVIGLIDQPIREERWVGCVGHLTKRNNTVATVTPCPSVQKAGLCTTSDMYFTSEQKAAYEKLRQSCREEFPGEDGYSYGLMASGSRDLIIDACLKPYDFCALVPIITGAGGIITDWHGQPLTLESAGNVIAAGSPAIAQTARKLFEPLIAC